MIEIAKEQTANHSETGHIEFRKGTAEALPVEDSIADIVLAFDSIDHWIDSKKGLTEVSRILKPNGKFIMVKDGGVPKKRRIWERNLKMLD